MQFKLLVAALIIFSVASPVTVANTKKADALLRLINSDENALGVGCPANMAGVIQLYKETDKIISELPPNADGIEKTHRFKQKIRSFIVHRSGKQLAEFLNAPNSLSTDYGNFIKQLMRDFDKPIISAIFATAINEIFPFKTPDKLALFMWQIYNHHAPDNSAAYALMVEQQLQLFWKFIGTGEQNDAYVFNVSYYFYKIKMDAFYSNMPLLLRQRLDKAITMLPSSMRQLFFKPYFCLLNLKYMENVYAAEYTHDWDSQRRTVYSWNDQSWVGENGYWLHEIIENIPAADGADTKLNLQFQLRSDKFKMFMYMDRNMNDHSNIIAVWKSGNAPANSKWHMELIDNQVVFSQNGYLMCNSERFHNAARRFLYGFQDTHHTKYSQECQWILDGCERYR